MLDLNELKQGYVILYEKEGKLGQIIYDHQVKLNFSKDASKYTHVEILGGGPYSVKVNPPGSQVVDLRKEHAGRTFVVLKYLGDDFERRRHKIAFWSASLCNIKYDYLGVLKFKLKGLVWHSRKRYFCSENCTWAFQKEYKHFMKAKPPHKVTPADFYYEYERGRFEKVYSGTLQKKKNGWKVTPIRRTPNGKRLKGGIKFTKKF